MVSMDMVINIDLLLGIKSQLRIQQHYEFEYYTFDKYKY